MGVDKWHRPTTQRSSNATSNAIKAGRTMR